MKSMTGYGEASHQGKNAKITVQVRSLNHRHLDLQLRVPREYLGFEEEIRKSLRETVSRGRIDLFINRTATPGYAREVELDEDLLGKYLKAIQRAKNKFDLAGEINVANFASIPDLLRVRDVEANAGSEKEGLFAAVRSAIQKLEQSRTREGRQLKADMQSQLRHLKKIAADLEKQAAHLAPRLEKNSAVSKNAEAAARMPNEEFDPGNWVVLKGDVHEEVVRLKTHIAALSRVIQENEPVGKKIDFMLQEVQRELNTISSKIPLLPVVQLVLSGKERVEKIREQTQNIE
ncbi:MAG: YicC family protein [Deltaproteobacteria bacterium]|nr:YicC family protein [Deltaproteobacteria bacterium]